MKNYSESPVRISTGPQTLAGKRRSRGNAVRHGVYAREIFLPGEDPTQFVKLHRELREKYSPDGSLEELAVLEVAKAVWGKLRLHAAQAAEIARVAEIAGFDRMREEASGENERTVERGLIANLSGFGLRCAIELLAGLRTNFEAREYDEVEDSATLREIYGAQVDSGLARKYTNLARLIGDSEECGRQSLRPEDLRKKVGELIGQEMTRLQDLLRDVEAIEARRADLLAQCSLIPSSEAIGRLVLWADFLDRVIDRNLDRLDRLQRRRLGLPSPPTVRISRR